MSDQGDGELTGPDFGADGVSLDAIPDGGLLLGHAGDEAVVLARRGADVFALGATCSHYGGPLAEGIFDGELVRCPWHHACFRAATGEAARPPALNPVDRYEVTRRDGRLFVGAKSEAKTPSSPISSPPASVVIVGGGAAGNAAAETLRREGYAGPITMLSADAAGPYDRPNLSKDYLAGKAEADWIPLRGPDFYEEQQIDLRLRTPVTSIDRDAREVVLEGGERIGYGALLLATGADPIHLDTPGGDQDHVFYLRSLADSNAIIGHLDGAKSAVVVGASFIGLEVAASLVERGLEVHVVAPEAIPMERVLGPELGTFVRKLHEEHGVNFHLGHTLSAIGERDVTIKDGGTLAAEIVVMGVGVRPALQLAEAAGLTIDRGVVVDQFLQAAPGIWAAGDIARWPDAYSGERIRVEHWVVAERQGETAARNILGRRQTFDHVPFFWSQHYDVPINYVGHAEGWDALDISGNVDERDVVAAYRKGGKTLAVASIYRDVDSLQAELAMERRDEARLREIVPPQ